MLRTVCVSSLNGHLCALNDVDGSSFGMSWL